MQIRNFDGRIVHDRAVSGWHVNIYLSILYLYFFFNSVGLPLGLEYTTLLSPLFYFWLIKNNQRWILTRFFVFSSPFVISHTLNGVINPVGYFTSYCLLMAVYLVSYTFYVALLKCKNIYTLFRKLIVVNLIFSILALLLRNTEYSSLLWWSAITSVGEIPRLKLLTYEASYYSTLMVPFFLFSYFRLISNGKRQDYLLFFMTVLPLLLSFSFGVISALIGTLIFVQLLLAKKLYHKNKFFYLLILPLIVSAAMLMFVFTPFIDRLLQVLSGNDMSGMGRVYWSNLIAIKVASKKSLVWGVGFGQAKEYYDVMTTFMMNTDLSGWMNGRLYNSLAELFSLAGAAGLMLKLGLEVYLFIITKPYRNYFRFSIFLFIFIYQFTGSYTTNLAEYVLWIFAFTKVFQEFNVRKNRFSYYVLSNDVPIDSSVKVRMA